MPHEKRSVRPYPLLSPPENLILGLLEQRPSTGTALSYDHRGDALHHVIQAGTSFHKGHPPVHMCVQVDESWRHAQVLRIDGPFRCSLYIRFDLDDLSFLDGYIRRLPWIQGSVEYSAIPDENIVLCFTPLLCKAHSGYDQGKANDPQAESFHLVTSYPFRHIMVFDQYLAMVGASNATMSDMFSIVAFEHWTSRVPSI